MITQSELKELLDYDPRTGIFIWKGKKGSRACKGKTAGATDAYGYIVIRINNVLYKAHRLAWFYSHGEWPETNLDHINRIKNDNRIKNLRVASQSLNMHNAKRLATNSGFVGVSWDSRRNKWVSRIKVDYKTKFLGRFDRKCDAIAARKLAYEKILLVLK
jgi:hypothetical protein